MSKNYTGGLNFTWPVKGDTDWASVVDAALTLISAHTHGGGGAGTALPANSIGGSQLRLANAEALRARNAAGGADIDLLSLTSGDILSLMRVFLLGSTETLTSSGACSLTKTVTVLNSANLTMTLADGTEGQVKIVVNAWAAGASVSTVTPATTAGANTVALRQYGIAVFYYLGSEWKVLCGPNCVVTDDTETLTSSGAISLNTRHTILNGSSLAMTLADGTEGQVKVVTNIASTSATVAPSSGTLTNQITLNTNGGAFNSTAVFYFVGGKWEPVCGPGATRSAASFSDAGTWSANSELVICTGTTYTVTTNSGFDGQTVLVRNQASGNVTFGGQVMASGTYYLYSYLNGGWRRVALT